MAAEPTSAAEFVPASRSLVKLRRAAVECRDCPLRKDATQTVFGAGPRKAELMLVGEQPGDREDIEGEPSTSSGWPWERRPPRPSSGPRCASPAIAAV